MELEGAVKLDPDYVQARYRLAMMYLKMGRYRAAEFQLEETLRINPDFQQARFALQALRSRH